MKVRRRETVEERLDRVSGLSIEELAELKKRLRPLRLTSCGWRGIIIKRRSGQC